MLGRGIRPLAAKMAKRGETFVLIALGRSTLMSRMEVRLNIAMIMLQPTILVNTPHCSVASLAALCELNRPLLM